MRRMLSPITNGGIQLRASKFIAEVDLGGRVRKIEVDSFSEPLQLAWTAFADRAASAGHQLPM
jgi:hypothetical protein